MDIQALALAFLSAVTVGGLAWVFIYPLLSGEKQAEQRRASFTRNEPALRIDDRSRTRRVQVEDSIKELEQRLAASKKVSLEI
ncbi:MAG TPA: pilus assembly protein, partial [Afipia sp.]